MNLPKSDLPQGTLDIADSAGGWRWVDSRIRIAQRLRQISRDVFQVQQGCFTRAASPRESRTAGGGVEGIETGREAKFYKLRGRARRN